MIPGAMCWVSLHAVHLADDSLGSSHLILEYLERACAADAPCSDPVSVARILNQNTGHFDCMGMHPSSTIRHKISLAKTYGE